MVTHIDPTKRSLLEPLIVFIAVIGLLVWGAVTAISGDPKWFLGGASLPDPQRIVIRVEGEEAVLTRNSPGYDIVVRATKKAL